MTLEHITQSCSDFLPLCHILLAKAVRSLEVEVAMVERVMWTFVRHIYVYISA